MKSKLLLLSIFICVTTLKAQICFTPETGYSVGTNTSSICTADFNGDGSIDIAAANKTGTVSILLNDGAGGFGTASDFTVGYLANAICTADFNNDSIPDLATTNLGPWTVSAIPGDGSGGFGTGITFGANTPYAITSADFNGDGNADLAVGTQYSVLIALGFGTGFFGSTTAYGAGHSYISITAADLNSDGIVDLAMAGSDNKAWILIGDGVGGFSTVIGFTADDTPESITSADFNGDGNTDLATANRFGEDVSILLGDGAGGFDPAVNFPAGSYPIALTSQDFNEDGNIDLAVAIAGDNNVSVLTGNGTGSFAIAGTFPVDSFPNNIATADFNGDGRMDLALSTVYTNNDIGKVDVLLNCIATEVNNLTVIGEPLNIYPNPNKGIFTINLPVLNGNIEKLEIYNVLGKSIYANSELQYKRSFQIDMSGQKAGMFFVKIYAEGKAYNRSLVVEK